MIEDKSIKRSQNDECEKHWSKGYFPKYEDIEELKVNTRPRH